MNGRRSLPKKYLSSVIDRLGLRPTEAQLFRESVLDPQISLDGIDIHEDYFKRFLVAESNYSIIAEWEHYAVISLIETEDFQSSPMHIAKRLGISNERAELVLQNLINAQLIGSDEDGNYQLNQGPLKTSEDQASQALRDSHRDSLRIGEKKLDEVDLELRDFSSITVAMNPAKIPEAKKIIREFRKKISSLLGEGPKSEVAHVAIQFYPLTNLENLNYKEKSDES
jgi:uncharacterized protein (TIGR02147 family)